MATSAIGTAVCSPCSPIVRTTVSVRSSTSLSRSTSTRSSSALTKQCLSSSLFQNYSSINGHSTESEITYRPHLISSSRFSSSTNTDTKNSACAHKLRGSLSTSPLQHYNSFLTSKLHTNSRPLIQSFYKRQFSSSKRDFYQVLGVSKGADKATIKKAYFKLAKQYHPDTNQGDSKAADKFKEVTEAYEVLSDDKQRELYDTYGHAGVDPNSGFSGAGGGGNPFQGFEGFNFSDGSFHFSSSGGPGGQIDPEDLFDAFFGGGGSRRRKPRGPRRGADLQMHIRLSFMDAVFGSTQDLNLRYQVQDPKTGRVEVKERVVEVKTPAGIDDGMNLRLAGQGAEGDPGAPRGNLIVTVIVDQDKYFHRDGADVHVEIPISVTQAILGGTVDVKTLNGEVEMKIPKGTQPESKLVMRGKGIPYLNGRGQKGNQIVHLKIEIPKEVTARQEELLREFDKEAEECGRGISGRLAKAAGSAFESFFGSKKSKSKKNDEDSSSSSSDDSKSKQDNDDQVEEKKHAS